MKNGGLISLEVSARCGKPYLFRALAHKATTNSIESSARKTRSPELLKVKIYYTHRHWKNQNAPRPSEHPQIRGGGVKTLGFLEEELRKNPDICSVSENDPLTRRIPAVRAFSRIFSQ